MTGIAFIGLGSMGRPLARLLAQATPDLAVYDPFDAALRAFEGSARLAASPADAAAGADVVGICVRDEAQVRDVLFGADGVVAGLAAGALVLVHSTISAEAVKEIASRLGESGVAMVDAPVSRTRRTEDEPFVYSMLGGDEGEVARAVDVVRHFSTDVKRMGPLGAGMAAKIANNLVTWVQIAIGVRSVEIALQNDVDYTSFVDIMKANGNLTPTMGALLAGKFQTPPSAERDEFQKSQGGIGEKDLALALASARAVGVEDGLIAVAQAMIHDVMALPPHLPASQEG